MKRFFPVVIILILICSMIFTGCNSIENTDVSTKDELSINQQLLETALTEASSTDNQYSFGEFKDTIIKWAEKNNINIESDNDTYLVLDKAASGEIKNVESFTFHTCIDLSSEDTVKHSLSSAATVMTILSTAQNHGDLRGIFTTVKNIQPVGAAAVNAEYLNYDNFIDVTYAKDTKIYNTFAADSNMAAVKSLDITAPTYTKAYKINFKGVSGQSAYAHRGTYPNPIKTIGDLLASCQTSTVLFELASFEGGVYSDNIPGKVTATIVLHENDVESFTKKFNNSYEKVEKMYEDSDAQFEYTMTPVDLPAQVISKEDTENIVSLMYTMVNGTYYIDENDEVIAVSNIGKITTKSGQFKLNINAKSLDDEIMTELEGAVKTICGLSDISYKKISSSGIWTNNPETPLVYNFANELNAKCVSTLEMKHISNLLNTKSDMNLISWATNKDESKKNIKKVLGYMSIAGVELVAE